MCVYNRKEIKESKKINKKPHYLEAVFFGMRSMTF